MKKVLYIAGAAALVGFIYYKRRVLLKAQQEYYIKDLHPTAKNNFRRLIRKIEAQGYDVIITSGYRSFQKQEALKKAGDTSVSGGGSMHNYGKAIDVNLRKGLDTWTKSDSISKWQQTGVPIIAKQMGFTWGGDFKNYHDPVHFADKSTDIYTLKQLAYEQFGSDPKLIEGNKVNIT